MFNKKIKFKGAKYYCICRNEKEAIPIILTHNIERTTKMLDGNFPILLELTVTKVFTREKEIKEIENE